MNDDRTEGNVHYPERFRGATTDPAEHAAKHEERAREFRRQDLARLRRIENDPGGGGKGPVFHLGDRLAAALANGEHVERARKRGVSIGEIDRAFGNRSDRYRLAPETGLHAGKAREKAAPRLMQQVRGYLRLAEATAKLTGEDPDALKLDVLRRTTLWSAPPRSAAEGDERLEALDLLIHRMAGRVIREEKLADLFAALRRVPREDDGHSYPDRYAHHYCDVFEFAMPMPGTRLARLPAAELPVSAFPVERTDSGVVAKGEFRGTLRLFRDVRLVIGPTTDAERIGAMFESRPHVELVPDSGVDANNMEGDREREMYIWRPPLYIWFDSWAENFSDEKDAIESDMGEHVLWTRASLRQKDDEPNSWREFYLKTEERVRLIGDICDRNGSDTASLSSIYWRPGPTVETPHPSDDWQDRWTYYWATLLWKPVDVAHIADFLDRRWVEIHELNLSLHSDDAAKYDNNVPDRVAARESPQLFWFPAGTVAFSVERRLVTGAVERELRASCACIRRDLERRVRERRKKLEERDARLLKEWSDDTDRDA